jgi:hypothetical protein
MWATNRLAEATSLLPPPTTLQDAAAAVKDDLAASAKLAASAADLIKQLPQAQDVCDCLDAILAGDLDGASLGGAEALLLPLFAPGGRPAAGLLCSLPIKIVGPGPAGLPSPAGLAGGAWVGAALQGWLCLQRDGGTRFY